jgi:transposase
MIDLKSASRDEVIRLVIAQHETIAQQERTIAELRGVVATLEATVAQLTARVGEVLAALDAARDDAAGRGSGRPQGMPGLKPAPATVPPPKQPRKRREQAFVRQRMAATQQVIHALDRCPQCGMPLDGGSVKRTREVIEVPVAPAVVTEHVYLERCCPHCRTRHTPAGDLVGAVVGKQRFGVGLVSLIATLREEARLPMATIQWYLATFHQLAVSRGAIAGAIQQVARAATETMTQIRAAIRGSPVAHLDETGWRENGVNGYAWVCATPEAVCFARGDRSAAMVERLLGEGFAGVLVSDFYAGYHPYVGVKQKCWAHLLRDVHDLRVAHPQDAAVQGWAAGVHDVYEQATTWKQAHPTAESGTRQAAAGRFAAALTAVYAPYVESTTPQRVLSARMAKHLHELFVFVVEPAVPPDNNRAERDLRHLVTSRKISGGTRSGAGSAAKMTLASVFGTWRVREENPYDACRALLISPQP